MPGNEWLGSLEFWTAASTVVIAGFTVALFVLQKRQHSHDIKVADANYRLSLHDKRLEVISAVEEFVADFHRSGEPSLHKAAEMMFRLRDADLLFAKEALEPIKEFRDKSGQYYVLKSRVDHLSGVVAIGVRDGNETDELYEDRRAEEIKNANAEIGEARKEMLRISNWVIKQTSGQRDDIKWLQPLRQFMKLPPTLKG
jgi:hypothetical protein